MSDDPAARYSCGATILGPRMGRNVVLWTKQCRRIVKVQGDHCRDHQGRGPFGPGARR